MGVRCQRQPSIWTGMAALAGSTNVISSRSDAPVLRFEMKKGSFDSSRIHLANSLRFNDPPGPVSSVILLIISHLRNFLKKYRKTFYRKSKEIFKK